MKRLDRSVRYHLKKDMSEAKTSHELRKGRFTTVVMNCTDDGFNCCGHGLVGDRRRSWIKIHAMVQAMLFADCGEIEVRQDTLTNDIPLTCEQSQ